MCHVYPGSNVASKHACNLGARRLHCVGVHKQQGFWAGLHNVTIAALRDTSTSATNKSTTCAGCMWLACCFARVVMCCMTGLGGCSMQANQVELDAGVTNCMVHLSVIAPHTDYNSNQMQKLFAFVITLSGIHPL